jgi:hypothetical protein
LRRIGEQPGTINHALTTFLDSGDWSAASRHLPSFALNETQSEFGLLGVVLEGPVLRVLAHNGIHCCESGDHDPYESRLKQYEECGYFDLEHPKNLLGDIIQKAKRCSGVSSTMEEGVAAFSRCSKRAMAPASSKSRIAIARPCHEESATRRRRRKVIELAK